MDCCPHSTDGQTEDQRVRDLAWANEDVPGIQNPCGFHWVLSKGYVQVPTPETLFGNWAFADVIKVRRRLYWNRALTLNDWCPNTKKEERQTHRGTAM